LNNYNDTLTVDFRATASRRACVCAVRRVFDAHTGSETGPGKGNHATG